jgi:hypothetical protein
MPDSERLSLPQAVLRLRRESQSAGFEPVLASSQSPCASRTPRESACPVHFVRRLLLTSVMRVAGQEEVALVSWRVRFKCPQQAGLSAPV